MKETKHAIDLGEGNAVRVRMQKAFDVKHPSVGCVGFKEWIDRPFGGSRNQARPASLSTPTSAKRGPVAQQEPAYRDMPAPASQEAESLSCFIEAVEVFNEGASMSSKEELAALEEAQLAALEEIASIKEQIARAKARAAAGGDYGDADWYHRANRALRHKQIEHQSLLQRAAELRKRVKQEAHQDQNQRFEPAFIAAAKGMLDGDTFQRIVQRANASLATAPGQ